MIDHGLNGLIRSWLALALGAALILAVIVVVVFLWSSIGDADISLAGGVAMALGVVVALAVGIALMSLVFISSRRGYDEAARRD